MPEPLEGYIVLHRVGGLTLVFVPGEGIKWIPPEDPEWGKRVAALVHVLDSAQTLVEVGAKTPEVRSKCYKMAEELVEQHSKEINAICHAQSHVHA
ncbi:MAG: hypothetical protein LAP86_34110 [Acidobacteriia bacterium]|nr:hypothetical protein [Terriglobia bacterium]